MELIFFLNLPNSNETCFGLTDDQEYEKTMIKSTPEFKLWKTLAKECFLEPGPDHKVGILSVNM